jgi:hypothetical protein
MDDRAEPPKSGRQILGQDDNQMKHSNKSQSRTDQSSQPRHISQIPAAPVVNRVTDQPDEFSRRQQQESCHEKAYQRLEKLKTGEPDVSGLRHRLQDVDDGAGSVSADLVRAMKSKTAR